MLDNKSILRVGAIASAIAAAILAVQIFIGFQIGPELASLQSFSPSRLGELLANSSGKLRGLMALDDAFVIAYLIAFVGMATATWERRALAILGLGAGIVTGFFDLLENSITLGLVGLYFAEQARMALPTIGPNHLLVLNIVSQMKWLGASVAAASFGAAIWDARVLNRVVSMLFFLFALTDVWGMIGESGALARVLSMLFVFIAGAVRLGVSWRSQK